MATNEIELPHPIICDDCKKIVDRLYYDQYGEPVCAECWIAQEEIRLENEDEDAREFARDY